MNITKRITAYLITAAMLLTSIGCQQTREIPDEDLIKIFHDAYLANAYMGEKGINEDSLFLYEPIFERYGYSVEDMQNTLKTFSKRKSALLSDLMVEVSKQLEREAKIEGRKIVVTPGLVELGKDENLANLQYGKLLSSHVDKVIIVGKKNAEMIISGLVEGGFDRENIYFERNVSRGNDTLNTIVKEGDVVLFENDLPDNYV
jgi:hypothetical protein